MSPFPAAISALTLALLLAQTACGRASAAPPTITLAEDPAADAFAETSLASESGEFCAGTADLLFAACGHDRLDDYYVASARCLNVSDGGARAKCVDEAKAAREESTQLCQEQRDGRREACSALGQGRYDPAFDPASFDDPRHPSKPNPFFPLAVGHRWEYRGGDEVDTVEVVDETKLVDGVTCLVVRDVVRVGELDSEATDDWFASSKDGTVWYCGEEVKSYETFDGDAPRRPELVGIDGSFKAGRERDKPGIIFQASPAVGQAYLEEFSLGNAEDATEILSTSYAWGQDPELDRFVPRALAELLCAGDCVVTRNVSLLEPGVEERKYLARGIGVFLEVDRDEGVAAQLTSCNVDPRCSSLPAP